MSLLGFRIFAIAAGSLSLIAGCSSPNPKDAPTKPSSSQSSKKGINGAELGEKGVFPGTGEGDDNG